MQNKEINKGRNFADLPMKASLQLRLEELDKMCLSLTKGKAKNLKATPKQQQIKKKKANRAFASI